VDEFLSSVESALGYGFRDRELLVRALTHASAQSTDMPSNERLEFLGDAVLGLAVSDHLFRTYPEQSEGEMTVIKSSVVSRRTLARAGTEQGLPAFLMVDEGLKQRRRLPASMVANVFEALVGAIFLDGGMGPARDFIMRTLAPHIEQAEAERHRANYKSLLQERSQAGGKGIPQYEIVGFEGPDHRRRFEAVVVLGGQECGRGWGQTKKEAEQNAAHEALDSCYAGWTNSAGEPPADG
jgi:ribonuclease-3